MTVTDLKKKLNKLDDDKEFSLLWEFEDNDRDIKSYNFEIKNIYLSSNKKRYTFRIDPT